MRGNIEDLMRECREFALAIETQPRITPLVHDLYDWLKHDIAYRYNIKPNTVRGYVLGQQINIMNNNYKNIIPFRKNSTS